MGIIGLITAQGKYNNLGQYIENHIVKLYPQSNMIKMIDKFCTHMFKF
jgi:hypothetical protein